MPEWQVGIWEADPMAALSLPSPLSVRFDHCQWWTEQSTVRKFQSELPAETSVPFPRKKCSCVAKSTQKTTNWGTEISPDYSANSPDFFSSNENPCVVFHGGEREDTNSSRKGWQVVLLPPDLSFPDSCHYNVVLSPVSLVSRLLYFLWLFSSSQDAIYPTDHGLVLCDLCYLYIFILV